MELSITLIEMSIEFIIKLEYFQWFRNQSLKVQSDVRSDQRLDNEDNNQSQDWNISNNIHGRSLIYGVRGHSISWGYEKCEWEHSKAMSTGMRSTGIQCWKGTRGKNYTIERDISVGT